MKQVNLLWCPEIFEMKKKELFSSYHFICPVYVFLIFIEFLVLIIERKIAWIYFNVYLGFLAWNITFNLCVLIMLQVPVKGNSKSAKGPRGAHTEEERRVQSEKLRRHWSPPPGVKVDNYSYVWCCWIIYILNVLI